MVVKFGPESGEPFFRELTANLPDYVVLIDRQRRYLWTNRVAPTLSLERILASRLDDFVDSADLPGAIEAIERCFETGEATEYVVRAYGDGDRSYCYENRVVRTEADGGEPRAIILTRDITQRVQAEEALAQLQRRLEQSQRLESIGKLAGGVAHEFNNLLTVILAGVSGAREALAMGADPAEDLSDAFDAAERAAATTRQLLAFSRHSPLKLTTLDASELIDGVLRLLEPVMPESVQVAVERVQTPVWVRGDRNLLQQVLLNLCLNARDALPESGRLVIAVQPEGDQLRVRVRDTGAGIAPDHLDRIFEPFFTTKGLAVASGLGLAVAHGIVRQHGGQISVESELGKGTEVTVQLPLVPEPSQDPEVDAPAAGRTRIQ